MFDTEPDGRSGGLSGLTAPTSSVKEAIEEAGFGQGQILSAIAACGVFFAEGLELMLVSLLAASMVEDLEIEAWAGIDRGHGEGFMISSIFAGVLIGNILSGPLADRVGRQSPIILAYVLIVLFGVISSFSNSLVSISVLRLFVGLGTGLGQPAAVALLNEITPERWQLATTVLSSIAFGAGALFAVILVMAENVWLERMTALEWRLALRCGSVAVMLLGMLAVSCLPESPAFLAECGDYAHARDTIQGLRKMNGKGEAKVALRQPSPAASPLTTFFNQADAKPTLVVCATSMVVNFAFYGSGYAVPQILALLAPEEDVQGGLIAPASVLLLAMVFAGVTIALCTFLGSFISRKTSIIGCLAVGMFAALLFNAVSPKTGFGSRLVLMLACLGLCTGPPFCYLCLVQTSAAMFPAARSATDISACMSLGRIGAITAPLVFDAVSATTGDWQPFFNAMAMLQLTCAILMLPMEFGGEYPYATFLGPAPKGAF